ncbi:MAG TPA: DUF4185 domain-containing protein [Terracidiphilus sp.]|nr:DUF4185 domain-containing protein [Terracidiphilus sp.]
MARSPLRSLVATGLALATGSCARPPLITASSGPPELTVVQATDLGPIPTNPDILGRDGGYSALFDGNSVWLYGDTFLARPNAQGFTLISDSWSYTSDLNAQSGITGFKETLDSAGAPEMILPLTAAELAFNEAHNANPCQQPCGARWALWPMSIAVDPATNQALVFYQLVSAAPGNFNFQGIGESVATWQSLTAMPVRPTLNPPIVTGHPDLLFGGNDPGFGAASLIVNGMLYVYGCSVANNGLDKGCRVARVAPAQAQNRSTWTFYAGSGNWSAQDFNAVAVFEGNSILSVDWNSYLGLYVTVYSAQFSQNVMIRTAKAPEGPWSDATVAFVAMQPASGNTYDAHAHAEYDVNGGQTIFVSYSRNLPALFTSEVRLVAVELKARSAQ